MKIVSGIYLKIGNVMTSVSRCFLMHYAMPDNFEFESYFSLNSFHGFLFSSHCTN